MSGAKRRVGAARGLTADLAALPDLPSETLKARWTDLFGRPPPARLGRKLLIYAIGYRLQEHAHGGLDRATQRQLAQAADKVAAGRDPASKSSAIKPGTRLLREWHGVMHEVIIDDHGVRYGDRVWPSLSAVAREITGTRWSGPRFFGLTGKSDAGG